MVSIFGTFAGFLHCGASGNSGGANLEKVAEYLLNAAEARKLAERAESPEQRKEFIGIAEAWERLAKDRAWRMGSNSKK